MSETTPNAKGPARFQGTPEAAGPAPIPADQVKPEEVAKLSIEYRDGRPVVVANGGQYIPSALPIVNSSDAAGFAWSNDVSYLHMPDPASRIRRESTDPVDLFYAHIGSIDAFAR
ncbi:hypothetical protein [Streptomyces niveus]